MLILILVFGVALRMLAGVSAQAQDDSLQQVLSVLWSIVRDGSGAGVLLSPVIFGAIEALDSVFHFTGDQKRGLALTFAFAAPLVAYGAILMLTDGQFNPLTLFIAVATGGYLATQIHDSLEARYPKGPVVGDQQPPTPNPSPEIGQ